jgi:hypothetical protein
MHIYTQSHIKSYISLYLFIYTYMYEVYLLEVTFGHISPPWKSIKPNNYNCCGTFICISIHVYIDVYISICTYVYVYIFTYVCIHMYIYIHTSINIHTHTYIYIYIHICVYMSTDKKARAIRNRIRSQHYDSRYRRSSYKIFCFLMSRSNFVTLLAEFRSIDTTPNARSLWYFSFIRFLIIFRCSKSAYQQRFQILYQILSEGLTPSLLYSYVC